MGRGRLSPGRCCSPSAPLRERCLARSWAGAWPRAVGPRGLVVTAWPSPGSSAPCSCPSSTHAFALVEAKARTLPLAITP